MEMYGHKTIIRNEEIPCPIEDFCPCGIDIGYSAIKVKSPHTETLIPSICIKVQDDEPYVYNKTDIRYKDEHGNLWFIGALAKKMISSDDAFAKSNNLLSRSRLQTEEFLVQIRVAMFFSMCQSLQEDGYVLDSRPLKIQTGLPPQFLKRDKKPLCDRFVGKHKFSVRVGQRPWVDVKIELTESDVYVCRQPFGTLMSVALDTNGNLIDQDILGESILVVDPGFYSVDTLFTLKGQAQESNTITWENLAMKEVFQRTCNDIAEATNNQADVDVYQLEKSLKKGFIYYGQRKDEYDYSTKLKLNLAGVCKELISKLNATYNHMIDVDVLILTGGTGKAWQKFFEIEYGDMKGLRLVVTDGASANSKGYYNYLISKYRGK